MAIRGEGHRSSRMKYLPKAGLGDWVRVPVDLLPQLLTSLSCLLEMNVSGVVGTPVWFGSDSIPS